MLIVFYKSIKPPLLIWSCYSVVNLCEERNGGCSHYCHSTHGQSYCSCPSGTIFQRDSPCFYLYSFEYCFYN